ncbi:MAG: sugar transferase [Verrucomicrobiales bacterium]|nr:sugar transferase [Verrucomicrobiales bacterium]
MEETFTRDQPSNEPGTKNARSSRNRYSGGRYLRSSFARWEHRLYHRNREGIKRGVDIAGALLLILILSPLLVATSLVIVISDGFPILFVHRRVGRNGHLFKLWKFRTMRRDAELIEKQAHEHKIEASEKKFIHPDDDVIRKLRHTLLMVSRETKYPKDPRIIPCGSFIRKFSLDELPQLFNVLSGSMSLVGPRPFVKYEVDNYSRRDQTRHEVRPGLSGLWQVSDRESLTRYEAIGLDLKYIASQSLWFDLKIMLQTIPAALGNRGGN